MFQARKNIARRSGMNALPLRMHALGVMAKTLNRSPVYQVGLQKRFSARVRFDQIAEGCPADFSNRALKGRPDY